MRCATIFLALSFALARPVASEDVSSKDARNFVRELKVLLSTEDAGRLEDFIVKMGELDDPRTVILIPPAAVRVPSKRNYDRALEAIRDLANEESVEALAKQLEKGSAGEYQEKVLVLEGFGLRNDPASLAALNAHLKSRIVHVRLAAIRAAAARRAKESVPDLISLLAEAERARDLIWFETRHALLMITAQDFETVDDWTKWWDEVKDRFDPAQAGKESGATAVKVSKREDAVQFFGTEIFSRNVVFVIDVSLSMLKYDDSPDYKGTDIEQDRQRLARAKLELEKALKLMPRAASFNIIWFSNRVKSWQKGLRPASKGNLASAIKFVRDLRAIEATHTDEALDEAFKDLAIDTIVLLSDGAPMKRGARDSGPLIEKILERVADINSSRKVAIHTFGFDGKGTWPSRVPGVGGAGRLPEPSPEEVKQFIEFMKALAKDHRGIYRAIQ